ncbi:hypothetical protein F2Q68_00002974 [Brassica cretica]|uniref:Uncharacterized protein n=1 Tax=Brassica cretica TaxID=69181 RepID=A0A8S9JA82_BRACR|nr:hypothetical protein F2Q68_00002974 [Brassica cretica]
MQLPNSQPDTNQSEESKHGPTKKPDRRNLRRHESKLPRYAVVQQADSKIAPTRRRICLRRTVTTHCHLHCHRTRAAATRHHLLSVCHQRTLKNKPKLTTIETFTPPPEIPSRRKQRSSDPRNHPTKPPSNLSTTGAPPSRGADKLRRGFLTPHAPSLLRNHQRQGKSEPVRDTIRTRSEAKVEQSPSSSDATIQNANRDPMGSPDLRLAQDLR